jgi:replication initiator protein RepSA
VPEPGTPRRRPLPHSLATRCTKTPEPLYGFDRNGRTDSIGILSQVLAATYHQVWWPSTDTVRFAGDRLPVWDEGSGNYLDPVTGEVLQTWDAALDAIGPGDAPRHVARFGPRFDAQGVLAGSKDADRCIGYLTKYLTKWVTPEVRRGSSGCLR